MKNNYTLILLKNSKNILVSDEEVKINDKIVTSYFGNDYCITNVDQITNGYIEHSGNDTVLMYIDDVKRIVNEAKYSKKIIAGIEPLPTLTYSDEVKQEIKNKYGWVDVRELARNKYPINDLQWSANSKQEGFIEGFKAHQSLTNKRFSLEDVKLIWKLAKQHQDSKRSKEHQNNPALTFKQVIQSLQQPIELNVEVEQICGVVKPCDCSEMNVDCQYLIPKIINNSILITKILN